MRTLNLPMLGECTVYLTNSEASGPSLEWRFISGAAETLARQVAKLDALTDRSLTLAISPNYQAEATINGVTYTHFRVEARCYMTDQPEELCLWVKGDRKGTYGGDTLTQAASKKLEAAISDTVKAYYFAERRAIKAERRAEMIAQFTANLAGHLKETQAELDKVKAHNWGGV